MEIQKGLIIILHAHLINFNNTQYVAHAVLFYRNQPTSDSINKRVSIVMKTFHIFRKIMQD